MRITRTHDVGQRVEKFSMPEPNSGCLLWTAGTDLHGYAVFRVDGRTVRVHRLAYEMSRGPIPSGLVLDHLCRVRCCVNPAHMEPVTQAENKRRGMVGRNMRGKTHCPRGHVYSAENTYTDTSGFRRCRQCRREKLRSRLDNRLSIEHPERPKFSDRDREIVRRALSLIASPQVDQRSEWGGGYWAGWHAALVAVAKATDARESEI